MTITFPEFLTVVILIALVETGAYLLYKKWQQWLSGHTKYGQKVYKMSVPQKVGFDLSIEQLGLAEDAFIDIVTKEPYLIPKKDILEFFKNNTIIYRPFPFPVDKSVSTTGYACETYHNDRMELGIQPFVYKTALVHGWVHDVFDDLTPGIPDDTDHDHTKELWWEGGLVSDVNKRIKEELEKRGWAV